MDKTLSKKKYSICVNTFFSKKRFAQLFFKKAFCSAFFLKKRFAHLFLKKRFAHLFLKKSFYVLNLNLGLLMKSLASISVLYNALES